MNVKSTPILSRIILNNTKGQELRSEWPELTRQLIQTILKVWEQVVAV